MRKCTVGWLTCLATVLSVAAARADKLPTGEEIMDRYVEVTGGKDAYAKLHNRVSHGTMEVVGLGIKGKLTLTQAEPARMQLEADIPGIGKIEEGTDGETVWEKSTVGGARVKTGDERTHTLRAARFHGDVGWRDIYAKAENVGTANVDGKACYKIKLTTPEGQVRTNYYDQKTGLLVKSEATEKVQGNEVATEGTVSDYQKVDGVLIPFKLRQKALTQEIVMTFDKIEHNVNLPADRFKLPDDVKALVDKAKGDKK